MDQSTVNQSTRRERFNAVCTKRLYSICITSAAVVLCFLVIWGFLELYQWPKMEPEPARKQKVIFGTMIALGFIGIIVLIYICVKKYSCCANKNRVRQMPISQQSVVVQQQRNPPESPQAPSDRRDSTPTMSVMRDSTPTVSDMRDSTPTVSGMRDSTPTVPDTRDSTPTVSDMRDSSATVSHRGDSSASVPDRENSSEPDRGRRRSGNLYVQLYNAIVPAYTQSMIDRLLKILNLRETGDDDVGSELDVQSR